MGRKLISVVGPTGIGKTKLAIELAKHFRTEIISCDARQFYKEMPIGTAMPSEEELHSVPHHFIGHLSIQKDYSIGAYEKDALEKLDFLFKKHAVVVMVGGSGMYEKAIIKGLDNLPSANEENIKKLTQILEEKGIKELQTKLKNADPEYFSIVDLENPRRLLRALDIYLQTGKPYSSFLNRKKVTRDFETFRIGIKAPRDILYSRINFRVDEMMKQGLLKEVEKLYDFRDKRALKTVGYTELFQYLSGEWDLEFAVEEIKKNTRRYAKRQLTWYRKSEDIHYLDLGYSEQEILSLLKEFNL